MQDQSDRHILEIREEPPTRLHPVKLRSLGDRDFGHELAAAPGDRIGQQRALRQQTRARENHVDDADQGQRGTGQRKLEERKSVMAQLDQHAGHKQVCAGADQGHHAAEDCGEGQRHHQPRG